MLAAQLQRRWLDPVAKAVGGGALLLAGTTIVWSVVLSVNVRVSPSIPWFIVIDLGVLYLAFRYLQHRDISSDRLGLGSLTKQAVAFGATAIAACYCLGIVEGALAGIQVGPFKGLPGVPALTSNLAVLFLPVYAAVSEELTFRGIVQSNLERAANRHWAIAIATLLFLAVHFQRPDFAAQWMFITSLSVALGIVAATFRSLALCILLHVIGNLVSVLLVVGLGPFHLGELTMTATFSIAALGLLLAALAVKILRSSAI